VYGLLNEGINALIPQNSTIFTATLISSRINFYEVSYKQTKTPWLQSVSELYRSSHRRLSAKLVPTFADRGCHVVSVTDPYGRILGSIDWTSAYSKAYYS
jgi:CBS-domain-containing membrane protein